MNRHLEDQIEASLEPLDIVLPLDRELELMDHFGIFVPIDDSI